MKVEVIIMYKFDTLSTEQFNAADKEKFYSVYDETLISKEPTTVYFDDTDEGEREVKLRLYIRTEYLYDETIHDEIGFVEMGVIPEFKELTKENQECILSQYQQDEQARLLKDEQQQLSDILDYGFGVPLHVVQLHKDEDVDNVINSAIAVRHAVTGFIGFELDVPRNRVGNKGWDFLSEYCEGKDLIELALARFS